MSYVHIVGRLTSDPTQKDVNGIPCATFTVAEDTRRKDKDGNKITNFWRVTAWRGWGENAAKYLHKGNQVYVVGNEVNVNTYTDKNGNWRWSLETTVADMRFLSSAPKPKEIRKIRRLPLLIKLLCLQREKMTSLLIDGLAFPSQKGEDKLR